MFDLHIHSNFSDGSFTPRALIKLAKKIGLDVISITDHDGIDGTAEAILAGSELGIKVITGIEISVSSSPKDLHLLGYNFDYKNNEFVKFVNRLKRFRDDRNILFIEEFRRLGINIDLADIQKYSLHDYLGKPHFAMILKERGITESFEEAFVSEKYFRIENFKQIKKEKPSDKEGIEAIRSAGGSPVLAHPGLLNLEPKDLRDLIDRLKSYGLMGIECYYSGHSAEFTEDILKIAKDNDLIITAGSDFHGNFAGGGRRSRMGFSGNVATEVAKLELPFL